MEITDGISGQVFAVDKSTGQILYANKSARRAEDKDEDARVLREYISEFKYKGEEQIEIGLPIHGPLNEKIKRTYRINLFEIKWDEEDSFVAMAEDISEEKKERERITRRAKIDDLTGLLNRHYIMTRLEKWLKEKKGFCAAFIDIDNLKYANDEFGHKEGDLYIIEITNLLKTIDGHNEIGRIGGDEFLLLAEGIDEKSLTEMLLKKRVELQQKGTNEGSKYCKSFSFGISFVPGDSQEKKEVILRNADLKMYEFKMSNKPQLSSAKAPKYIHK